MTNFLTLFAAAVLPSLIAGTGSRMVQVSRRTFFAILVPLRVPQFYNSNEAGRVS